MNKVQFSILTAGMVLIGLSCLFPLWRPSTKDFAFLLSPPPSAIPDGGRLSLEWLFLASATGIGLILTRNRRSITTVYPIFRHAPVDALPADVLDKWEPRQRKKMMPRR